MHTTLQLQHDCNMKTTQNKIATNVKDNGKILRIKQVKSIDSIHEFQQSSLRPKYLFKHGKVISKTRGRPNTESYH